MNSLLLSVFILLVFVNLVAYFHAYCFITFDPRIIISKTEETRLALVTKLRIILFGVKNPRPKNDTLPDKPFLQIVLKGKQKTDCWLIEKREAKGTVLLFHGYGGSKSTMLDKAVVFYDLGYQVMLVDFRGCGDSEGNKTTIGYYESEEVKKAVTYLHEKGEKNIILFGISMGAVAIMKALSEEVLDIRKCILECPFGSMLQAVQTRFHNMGLPSFPMANLLVFWGGFQSGFNPFRHQPIQYAKKIKCPVLILYGNLDDKVSLIEIDTIFRNLKGPKEIHVYDKVGHDNYLEVNREGWIRDIHAFLMKTENKQAS